MATAAIDIETGTAGGTLGQEERTTRRFDPFRALSRARRRELAKKFDAVMAERDGELDFEARTLSVRERELAAWPKGLRWQGEFDQDAFERQLRGRRAEAASAQMIWLIVAARGDESETWSVDLDIKAWHKRGAEHCPLAERYVLIEEQYHSKMLREVARTLGVTLGNTRPSFLTRMIIHGLIRLPGALRYIPVLGGEVLGTVVFGVLRDRIDVFSDQPEVEAHIRGLLERILEDETLHVAHCRSRLGPVQMFFARRMAGLISRAMMIDIPELAVLGCDRNELQRRIRSGIEIPAGYEWIAEEGE